MSASLPTLRLAVVGHTNTGKTSLMRTLARDPEFGEVRDSPGTTRHVEGARLLLAGEAVVQLFDTPGLEDSMALLDYLDQLAPAAQRLDGPERIRRFLDSPESQRRFEQEARVLAKLLDCDAALYVVDVRDPVLGKHKDELQLLAYCGRPLLAVLNFTSAQNHRLPAWRAALGRLGLHAMVEFDTIAPALDGEEQLYDKLALLMDAHASLLRGLKQEVIEQRKLRAQDALLLVADMLIDAAAWRLSSAPDATALEATVKSFRQGLRQRETRCVRALLKRYNFRQSDFPAHSLPLEGERWSMDLFHPQALKDMGIHVGKGVAAGAMAGATLDAFTAGISLGTATLLGAAAGGLWQGADKWGKRLMGRLRGWQEVSADDAVLRLLAVRQLHLLHALEQRGHAAQNPLVLDAAPQSMHTLQKGKLPLAFDQARAHPEWSSLAEQHNADAGREVAVSQLADELQHNRGVGQVINRGLPGSGGRAADQ